MNEDMKLCGEAGGKAGGGKAEGDPGLTKAELGKLRGELGLLGE